jgi:hypothetical protein
MGTAGDAIRKVRHGEARADAALTEAEPLANHTLADAVK